MNAIPGRSSAAKPPPRKLSSATPAIAIASASAKRRLIRSPSAAQPINPDQSGMVKASTAAWPDPSNCTP